MSKSITAPGDNSHAHRCVACDAQIPCDNPGDAGEFDVSTVICANCEEDFRDQEPGPDPEDQGRTNPSPEAKVDDFDGLFGDEDQMGKDMLEASQAVGEFPPAPETRQGKRRPVPKLFKA